MLRHNFLLIYRNFRRFRSTFFINLIGLSAGLACTLLIYLWVSDELKMDKFHEKDDRLFTVMANHTYADGIVTFTTTPGLLAPALQQELPGIERTVRASGVHSFRVVKGDMSVTANGQFVSNGFFDVFSYKLKAGDQVLADPHAIVISESLARKLFNTTENVLGKTIEWQVYNFKQDVVVTGVFEDVPVHTSEPFDFLLSFDYYEEKIVTYPFWNNNYAQTYVLLKQNTRAEDLTPELSGFLKTKAPDSKITVFLAQHSGQYLYGKYVNGIPSGGRIEYVRLFSLIAVFILIIACINFMNLSTAKASGRIKEVGIKKAIGAHRGMLVLQYLGESMFMAFLSLLIAVLLVDLFLSPFNLVTGKHLELNFDGNLVLSSLAIVFITGLLSGSYPALYLSGFSPANVLRGRLDGAVSDLWARKGLVVFQFTLSVMLIVAVLVVYKQIDYVQNKNLGYNKDHIIYFEQEGKVITSPETVLSALKAIPGVIEAACTDYRIGGESYTYGINWEGSNDEYDILYYEVPVSYDAIDILGINMKEGRTFSRDFPSDSAGIIFNEAAIQAMGLEDPVGKTVQHYDGERTIIGVTKNFHYESLHNPVKPMFFLFAPSRANSMMVKLEAGKEKEAIHHIRKFFNTYNPGFSFNYKFIDEDYQHLYEAEQRVAVLSQYFAALAILISCLGLFGLAAFTAERRTKEIGIRKVLGSSNLGIIYLLSRSFTKMVLLAILMALPLSYFIVRMWLDRFAFRIDLTPWYFISAGLIVLFIAGLTVILQTLKAALVNPSECLKNE